VKSWIEGDSIHGITPKQLPGLVIKSDTVVNAVERRIYAQQEAERGLSLGTQNVLGTLAGTGQPPMEELRSSVQGPGVIDAPGGHIGFISSDDICGGASLTEKAAINPSDALAETANLVELMADENNGAASAGNVSHFPETFALEFDVSDSEDFVN
jgi:hypothetical protein